MADGFRKDMRVAGEDLLRRIKEIVHQGNVRRIIIKNEEGKTYLEIPLTVGIAGALLLPLWAAIGALAAMASNFTVEVIKRE